MRSCSVDGELRLILGGDVKKTQPKFFAVRVGLFIEGVHISAAIT